uniref:Uncharacterized protein n=1 Tax=Lepeophtheirus salmonis TaxID=72036 RepID=A0A0K2T0J8_LEPSM
MFLPNGIPVVQWLILPRRILRVLSIRLRIGSSIYDIMSRFPCCNYKSVLSCINHRIACS